MIHHQRIIMFMGGVVLSDLVTSYRVQHRLPRLGEKVVAIVYCVVLSWVGVLRMHNADLLPPSVNSGMISGLVLCVATMGFTLYTLVFPGFLRAWFSWTPLRWLGNISYSYYLLHGLVLQCIWFALSKIVPGQFQSSTMVVMLLPVSLVLTILSSAVLFLVIEKPCSLEAKKRMQHVVHVAEADLMAYGMEPDAPHTVRKLR